MRGRWLGLLVLPLLVFPSTESRTAFEAEEPGLLRTLGLVVTEVSGWDIYECIKRITQDVPTMYRLMGTPTHDLFVQKYARVFETDAKLPKSQVVAFDQGAPAPQGVALPLEGGHNILGVLPGRDLTKWIVVGGHYDTQLLTQGGGAIDNTSGICATLEIAKAFVDLGLRPEATVVFAWWDGEEWGLHGSRAFLRDHNATKLLLGLAADTPIDFVAAMSFDIIGINFPAFNQSPTYGDPLVVQEHALLNLWAPPDDPEHFTLCPRYGCYRYDQYSEDQLANFTNYQALVREVANGFLQLPPQFVEVKDDTYGRSDQVPFTAAGIPGLRVQGSHDNEFPQYHTPADTLLAAELLAGGETQLRGGFDRAADVGAVVAAYVALRGDVGAYGVPDRPGLPPAADLPAPGRSPAFEWGVAVVALVLGLGALRRR